MKESIWQPNTCPMGFGEVLLMSPTKFDENLTQFESEMGKFPYRKNIEKISKNESHQSNQLSRTTIPGIAAGNDEARRRLSTKKSATDFSEFLLKSPEKKMTSLAQFDIEKISKNERPPVHTNQLSRRTTIPGIAAENDDPR